jgi:predicted nucleotidyltransferase
MWKHINEPGFKELFDDVGAVFLELEIDHYLIGAIARDYWYGKEKLKSRISRDVDFAVLMPGKEIYQRVRETLKNKGFTETKQNAFAMKSPLGIQLDLLPFGQIEIDDAIVLEAQGMTSIKMNGFSEVYKAGTKDTDIGAKYVFKVATLPAIVLLKLISYDDRPEHRDKDPKDIAGILRNFFHLQSELIYTQHANLFTGSEDLELADISAMVIGREIKKLCIDNAGLNKRIENILITEIQKNETSLFLRKMQEETDTNIEQMQHWLQRVLDGLVQA